MEASIVEKLAQWVHQRSFTDLGSNERERLKIHCLDALGCALGALNAPLIARLRAYLAEFKNNHLCSTIGEGKADPDRAAFFNGALVRYLDFNDSYLAKGETCHPSDNLAPVLAAAEYADLLGSDFLTALAVAYQVQCRLSDEAPVRKYGFDHTTQGAYAAAAGVAKALGLNTSQIAHAIAMSGTAYNALRVTRTGALSNWKGLAYPNTAFGAVHVAFLAKHDVTGPREVFEGNKGLFESITGPFSIAWEKESFDRIGKAILKRYNAEVHSQSTLEGVLELRTEARWNPSDIAQIDVTTFEVAFNIIGGGEEGSKFEIHTKEEADHSLPYMVAVAAIDGQVLPAQYSEDRIRRPDVQTLLRKVKIQSSEALSRRFPEEMPALVVVRLQSGKILRIEKKDYEGFHTRPMSWQTALEKFRNLAASQCPIPQLDEIVATIRDLESFKVRDLIRLLRDL